LKKAFVLGLFVTLLVSCSRDKEASFSFFVAGHTYGAPSGINPGLHPPFIDMFPYLNDVKEIDLGVLTGDIVRKSTDEAWDTVGQQLKQLNKKVYLCPGNHDIHPREIFESRFGNTYYSFTHKDNLFIVLDGNLDRWNITGDQLSFLVNTLGSADETISNVFIFIHQLVWWDKDNIFSKVNLNWPPYTPDSTNYWSQVEPLLQDYRRPVFLFAGDLGANDQASPLMYYPDRNITYAASGMGNGKNDNFLIVHVKDDKSVDISLAAIGADMNRMGRIEDYQLH